MRRIKMQKSYHLPCSLVLEQCFHKVFLQVNFSAVLKCDVTPAERANPVGTTIVLLLQSRGGAGGIVASSAAQRARRVSRGGNPVRMVCSGVVRCSGTSWLCNLGAMPVYSSIRAKKLLCLA